MPRPTIAMNPEQRMMPDYMSCMGSDYQLLSRSMRRMLQGRQVTSVLHLGRRQCHMGTWGLQHSLLLLVWLLPALTLLAAVPASAAPLSCDTVEKPMALQANVVECDIDVSADSSTFTCTANCECAQQHRVPSTADGL